ncbi:MAG: GNAT family N-acetyltransferase [Acidobacteriota bacterium]|nr:GNAT family N-acetyltransferase [Acidobacteriota bacterium]
MTKLIQATNPEEIALARQLFEEYASWLEISLCFQNFDRELEGLPGDYAAPHGRLLLAFADDQLAGCIAVRRLPDQACEMKRLYVRPAFRGLGLGRTLVTAIIEGAKEIGYESMRLDTLPGKMDQALAMYRRFGFKEIPPYYENPVAGATFMELALG